MINLIEAVPAIGTGLLVGRRGWYGVCAATGYYLASQSGQTPDSKTAFALGRTQVIATLSSAVKFELAQVEWVKIAHGTAQAWKERRTHAHIAWQGMKRDAGKFWPRRRQKAPSDAALGMLKEHGNIASVTDVDVAGVAFDLEQRRAVLAAKPDKTMTDVREHDHISRQLTAHYAQNPAVAALFAPAAPQGLLGSVVGVGASKYLLIALGVSVAFGGVQTLREHISSLEAKQAKTELKTYKLGYTQVAGKLDESYTRINSTQAQCVARIDDAAKKASADEAKRVTEKLRRQKHAQDAAAAGAAAPRPDPHEWMRDIQPLVGAVASAGGPSSQDPGLVPHESYGPTGPGGADDVPR